MNGGQMMVVLIVAIVMIAGIFKSRHRRFPLDRAMPRDDAETARLNGEIRALKDRIAVLERVITDNNRSNDLAREIEKLRDNDRV